MSVFDAKSRYLKYAAVVAAVDARGRTVNWVTPARIPEQKLLGEHRKMPGHRLDRLAAKYLDDPTGYWRIATLNDATSPDAAADLPLIKIPVKEG